MSRVSNVKENTLYVWNVEKAKCKGYSTVLEVFSLKKEKYRNQVYTLGVKKCTGWEF